MRVHTAWLKTLVETIPGAVIGGRTQVFVSRAEYPPPDNVGVDGKKIEVTFPYWVIHPADGRDTQPAVTGPYVTKHPRFTVWTVALDADTAALAAENVRNVLVVNGRGVTPSIAGESSQAVWYSSPLPIQVDTTKTPALVYHVAEVGFDSQVI